MAQTQRKQVLKPGDKITSLTTVSNSGTKVRGQLADGSLHGLIKNLSIDGTGFNT
jgi:hypothetical protein